MEHLLRISALVREDNQDHRHHLAPLCNALAYNNDRLLKNGARHMPDVQHKAPAPLRPEPQFAVCAVLCVSLGDPTPVRPTSR